MALSWRILSWCIEESLHNTNNLLTLVTFNYFDFPLRIFFLNPKPFFRIVLFSQIR